MNPDDAVIPNPKHFPKTKTGTWTQKAVIRARELRDRNPKAFESLPEDLRADVNTLNGFAADMKAMADEIMTDEELAKSIIKSFDEAQAAEAKRIDEIMKTVKDNFDEAMKPVFAAGDELKEQFAAHRAAEFDTRAIKKASEEAVEAATPTLEGTKKAVEKYPHYNELPFRVVRDAFETMPELFENISKKPGPSPNVEQAKFIAERLDQEKNATEISVAWKQRATPNAAPLKGAARKQAKREFDDFIRVEANRELIESFRKSRPWPKKPRK
jgi:hypothetical protein